MNILQGRWRGPNSDPWWQCKRLDMRAEQPPWSCCPAQKRVCECVYVNRECVLMCVSACACEYVCVHACVVCECVYVCMHLATETAWQKRSCGVCGYGGHDRRWKFCKLLPATVFRQSTYLGRLVEYGEARFRRQNAVPGSFDQSCRPGGLRSGSDGQALRHTPEQVKKTQVAMMQPLDCVWHAEVNVVSNVRLMLLSTVQGVRCRDD